MSFELLLALIVLVVALITYLHVFWRERRTVITHDEALDQKITALFFAYMGVSLWGSIQFPVVHRDSGVIGSTPGMLWPSLFLAFPMTWLLNRGLHRAEHANPRLVTLLLSLLLPILNSGWLSLLNGGLDFGSPQVVEVLLLEKTASRSGKGGHTQLFHVADWNHNSGRIRIKTGGALYRGSRPGDTIELKLRRGALRVEWLQSLRNLSR